MNDQTIPDGPVNLNDLSEKLQRFADMSAELLPLRPAFEELDALEAELKEQIRELGQSYDHPAIFAQLRPGQNRTSWNGKALEAYSDDHPEILDYRRQYTNKPYVKLIPKETP